VQQLKKRKMSRFFDFEKSVTNLRSFRDHSINSECIIGTSAHYKLFSAMKSWTTITVRQIITKK